MHRRNAFLSSLSNIWRKDSKMNSNNSCEMNCAGDPKSTISPFPSSKKDSKLSAEELLMWIQFWAESCWTFSLIYCAQSCLLGLKGAARGKKVFGAFVCVLYSVNYMIWISTELRRVINMIMSMFCSHGNILQAKSLVLFTIMLPLGAFSYYLSIQSSITMQVLFRTQQFAVGRLIFSNNSHYWSSSIRLKQ